MSEKYIENYYQRLGNKFRRKIVKAISEKPRTFTYLKENIGKSAGNTNHHLEVLEKAGLIDKEYVKTGEGYKRGKEVIIKPNKKEIEEDLDLLSQEIDEIRTKLKGGVKKE